MVANKKALLFSYIASTIILLTIIVIIIAPIINGYIAKGMNDPNGIPYEIGWQDYPCTIYSDRYDIQKDKELSEFHNSEEEKKEELELIKEQKKQCRRRKAMASLEISIFYLNLIFVFICAFLGFLFFYHIINFGKIIGLIGLITGFIFFALILVYVAESILFFTDYVSNSLARINSNGGFLKWDNNKKSYTCIFYDKDDKYSVYLKYSDYGNKYLNYRKDIIYMDEEKNFKYKNIPNGCNFNYYQFIENFSFDIDDSTIWSFCNSLEKITVNPSGERYKYFDTSKNTPEVLGNCDEIFYIYLVYDNEYEILYNRWLTTIILSFLIIIFNICLSLFGFLLFTDSKGSSGLVPIKQSQK